MEFIKNNGNIFLVTNRTEWWWLKVYGYPESSWENCSDEKGKYHRVAADTEKRAYEIYERSYKEYDNIEVECAEGVVHLHDIITEEGSRERFLSLEAREEFVAAHKKFNTEDLNLIFRFKEMRQKERHHQETIDMKFKVGRAIHRRLGAVAGLPADWC